MAWPETVRRHDVDITWFNGKGGGGQHRNKHANCCRMVHKPTGFKATGQAHRERPANRRDAFDALVKKLLPLMKAAVLDRPGVLEMTERVRTYNFPRQTVTDHRTGKKYDLASTLDGDLDTIIRDSSVGRASAR